MKKVMMVTGIIIGFLLFAAITFFVWSEKAVIKTGKEYEQKLKTVELGMTKEQVKNIMGEPVNINKFVDYELSMESWYYPQDYAKSGTLSCVFDADSNKVIEIRIYGGYKTAGLLKDARNKSKEEKP